MKNKTVVIPNNFSSFFNISSYPSLSFTSSTLLPGLKHIPIPKDVSDYKIMESFSRFKNSTYWQTYHSKKELLLENDDELLPFNPKLVNRHNRTVSEFYKMKLLPTYTKEYMKDMEKEIKSWMKNNPTKKRNISEITNLKNLLEKYPSVIFKPADKNIGIVAMDITTYNEQVLKHLNNTENYEISSSNSLSEKTLNFKCLGNLKRLMENYSFNPQEIKYIKSWPSEKFRFPNFHVLPKLHKPGPLSSRPIAGAINWTTTPISTILENRLQEAVRLFPNILKNSQQLVKELEHFNESENRPQHFYIITGDVNALYPSIQQERLTEIFNNLGNNKFIGLIPLIEFILKNAYVKYNGKVFLQKNGIPMGTNAAVALANIYMGTIDHYISSRPRCIYYRRFIDDLFILWTGPLEEWELVANHCNKIIPGILIEWATPSFEQVFLDVNVKIDQFTGKIVTSPYQKPLNKYIYISPKSSHDRHTFKGFIKGELTRYARLSSNPFYYQRTKELFYERLLKRGYPRHFLYPIFHNHRWATRNYNRPPKPHKILPFVIPFTFRNNQQELKNIFYKYGNLFCEDFKDYTKPLFVYSKSKSLGSYLCPSTITRYHSQYLSRQTTQT